MKIWNTFTNKAEEFKPMNKGVVKMYNCGPTVYNFAHIGNLRSYIFVDVLRRALEHGGYEVKQVINITDVGHLTGDTDTGEDKVELEAKKEKKTAQEITAFYTQAFFSDLDSLNIPREKILFPKATEHIEEQIELIKKLEEKGFTYQTSDGIYFDTSKFPGYGLLGNINLLGIEEGARVEKNSEKRNATDFALWKLSPSDKERQQSWDSPWGIGFPGWHIECSAMSMKYLGETFDIHTGGIDHVPVHHNNEIAQSEGATGKPYARFWMHNAFVNVDGGKMAKSLGNIYTLADLAEHGIHPLSYKYLLLTAHYKSPIDFTFDSAHAAQNAFEGILRAVSQAELNGSVQKDYLEEFKSFIEDDLDTPKGIALLHKLLDDHNVSQPDKTATILAFDEMLGLNISELTYKLNEIPPEILKLGAERDAVRSEKNWTKSDTLRTEIESKGFIVQDSKNGTVIHKKLTPDM